MVRSETLRRMEFDHVRLTGQAQLRGIQIKSTDDPNALARFVRSLVGRLMQVLTLDGSPVLGPKSFEMDQRTLALAKQQVL
jgi:hypothetical protein